MALLFNTENVYELQYKHIYSSLPPGNVTQFRWK